MDAWTHAQCCCALKANQHLHDRLSTAILINFDNWLSQAETLADLRRALTGWLGSTSTESYVAPNYTDECRAALLRAFPQPRWYAVWGQKTKCRRTRILLVNTLKEILQSPLLPLGESSPGDKAQVVYHLSQCLLQPGVYQDKHMATFGTRSAFAATLPSHSKELHLLKIVIATLQRALNIPPSQQKSRTDWLLLHRMSPYELMDARYRDAGALSKDLLCDTELKSIIAS